MDAIRKVLIVVPHQDDELNLAGTILDQFTDSNICVSIIFTTNGDRYTALTEKRFFEMQKVRDFYKVKELIFLGYGDQYINGSLYDDLDNERLYQSYAGKNETYGIGNCLDYRYIKSGYHSKYCKKCFMRDLEDAILDVKADLIISVDCDSHPDHKTTSLCFDAVMGKLVKEKNYRPIILKKYAYRDTWFGPKDYFIRPMKESDNGKEFNEYDTIPYSNDFKVKVKVKENNYPLMFWKSPVYKSLRIYKSQRAALHFDSIVNADSVYYYRNVNNIALKCDISTSSGDTTAINDFLVFDMNCTIGEDNTIENLSRSIWKPDLYDKERLIHFDGLNCKKEFVVYIYQLCDSSNYIEEIEVYGDGELIGNYVINNTRVYKLDISVAVKSLDIKVNRAKGTNWGIYEIEIYEESYCFPWFKTPFVQYDNSSLSGSKSAAVFKFFYKLINQLEFYIPIKMSNRLRTLFRK